MDSLVVVVVDELRDSIYMDVASLKRTAAESLCLFVTLQYCMWRVAFVSVPLLTQPTTGHSHLIHSSSTIFTSQHVHRALHIYLAFKLSVHLQQIPYQ